MRDRIQAALSHPASFAVTALLGILLMAPSLDEGLSTDDYFHALFQRDDPGIGTVESRPLDVFSFTTHDVEQTRSLMDEGMLAWWVDPEVRLAFWRPLTSASHFLDYRLWPEKPFAMHAQNLFWWLLCLIFAGCLFRQLETRPWAAALALLLFAVDDAHGWTVGWVANRSAIIALAFGLLTLLFHISWRRRGWRAAAWWAPVFLALALLSAEAGIAACAYLFAFAVCLDRGPLIGRLLTLAPYAAVVVVWRVVYSALGYGIVGSGVYLDPVHSPLAYAAAVIERGPVLLQAQLGLVWSEFWMFIPARIQPFLWLGMVLFLMLLAWVFAPLWRRSAEARFWTVGMLLALLPVCATFPSDRLLLFVGLGGSGLLACFLSDWLVKAVQLRRSQRWVGALLVVIHLALAPLLTPVRALTMSFGQRISDTANATVPADPSIREKTVIAINGPHELIVGNLPIYRQAKAQPRPAAMRMLAPAHVNFTLSRIDESTVRIDVDGGLLANPIDHLARAMDDPFAVGETISLDGVEIEIVSITEDGRPAEVDFQFAVSLDDPSLIWLRWTAKGYVPYNLPVVGKSDYIAGLGLQSEDQSNS